MQILPVLDLMAGQVVRGVAGRRETYRPLQSVLAAGSGPLEIARALRRHLGLSRFYVADLDGILLGRPQLSILDQLAEHFPGLWLDCGVRLPKDVPEPLLSRDVVFILGLETIAGPGTVRELCRELGSERVVFSLDLKSAEPVGNLENWASPHSIEIAKEAIAAGVRKVIVLDLAGVGVGAGVSTLPLCRNLKRQFPEVEIFTGGGVRNLEDLLALKQAQIDGVLVASAFHNGVLGPDELGQLLKT